MLSVCLYLIRGVAYLSKDKYEFICGKTKTFRFHVNYYNLRKYPNPNPGFNQALTDLCGHKVVFSTHRA